MSLKQNLSIKSSFNYWTEKSDQNLGRKENNRSGGNQSELTKNYWQVTPLGNILIFSQTLGFL